MPGLPASRGPGRRTSRTGRASRTDSPACSPRPSPMSTASTRAPSSGGCSSPTTSPRTMPAASAARSRPSPGTRRSPAGRRRRRTRPATRPRSRARSRRSRGATSTGSLTLAGPRAVVIDDLHWLDPSSVTLVELLVEATADRPLIVLAGTRPTGYPGWVDRPDVQRIDLQGLAEPETARLATLVARAAFEADGIRSIHERTEGNPLFIGETVRAFLEDGTLEWRDGRVAMIESGPPRVPVTLRAVLGARIDALEPSGREALGRGLDHRDHVPARPRRTAARQTPCRRGTLDHLAEAAMIRRADEGEWRFAHALIRDAAYAGMLASRRRTLHARLADHLERPSPRAAAPGQIATHRVASGDALRALPAAAGGGRVGAGARGGVGGRGVLAAGRRPQRDRGSRGRGGRPRARRGRAGRDLGRAGAGGLGGAGPPAAAISRWHSEAGEDPSAAARRPSGLHGDREAVDGGSHPWPRGRADRLELREALRAEVDEQRGTGPRPTWPARSPRARSGGRARDRRVDRDRSALSTSRRSASRTASSTAPDGPVSPV